LFGAQAASLNKGLQLGTERRHLSQQPPLSVIVLHFAAQLSDLGMKFF